MDICDLAVVEEEKEWRKEAWTHPCVHAEELPLCVMLKHALKSYISV